MISFIIPAHNEELLLGATLRAIDAVRGSLDEPIEVIVVDDSSTDRTVEIATQHGAQVIRVEHRQIAATRNAGGRAARGDMLFFVDADTQVTPEAIKEARQIIADGAVGGGCAFRFDGTLPLWARLMYPIALFFARLLKLVGGCCLFCRRDVFEQFGGFDERHYAAEEVGFIRELKRRGRFVIPRAMVITSGRKLRTWSAWSLLSEALRWSVRGARSYQTREGLDLWYGPRRPDPQAPTGESR